MPEIAPTQSLSRLLRALRESHWPDLRVTQQQLAEAFGDDRPLSLSLISSWESSDRPTRPPVRRLRQYALFFATRRSINGQRPRLLAETELTAAEKGEFAVLYSRLMRLRDPGGHEDQQDNVTKLPLAAHQDTIGGGPYLFPDKRPVTIVCARLPSVLLDAMPYTDPKDPDFVRSYSYADIDSLVEIFGHIRAVNPTVAVNIRTADNMSVDDYTAHLVLLGGVDWNSTTAEIVRLVSLPLLPRMREAAHPYDGYFEVVAGRTPGERFSPTLEQENGRQVLREDLAHVFRAINPYNNRRTLTLCNGIFGRGTYGAVRALTDVRFRDRNERFLRERFGGFDSFSVLARVRVTGTGDAVTPDWTVAESRLHEWPEPNGS